MTEIGDFTPSAKRKFFSILMKVSDPKKVNEWLVGQRVEPIRKIW